MNAFYWSPIFFLFFSFIILLINTRDTNFVYSILVGFFFIAICGLRYFSDIDYEPYVQLYESTPILSDFSHSTISNLHGEYGYLLVSSLLKTLNLNFAILALIISFFSITLKIYVAEKYSGCGFYVFNLYLLICFFITEFIQVRWGVAIGLILIGYHLGLVGKFRVAIAVLLIAAMIHSYALLFLCLMPFVFCLSLRSCMVIFIISILTAICYHFIGFFHIIFFDSDNYVVKRFLRYANDPGNSVGLISYAKVLYYLIAYVVLNNLCKDAKYDFIARFYIKLAVLTVSAALMLSIAPIFFLRAIFVADFVFILVIVRICNLYLDFYNKLIFLFLFPLPMIIWFMVSYENNFSSGYILNYQTWLSYIF